MTDLAPPPPGHNRPPPDESLWADFAPAVAAFADGAARWTAAAPIEAEEDAAGIADFLAGGRKLLKEIDAARKEAKRPHDEAARAVQAAFAKPLDLLDRAVAQARGLLESYLAAKQARLDAERAEAIGAAERAVEEAQARLAAASSSGHVLDAFDAQHALDDAEAALKALRPEPRARVGSATGGGRAVALRTLRDVRITNLSLAFTAVRDDPAVVEAVTDAIRRRVRAAGWDGRPIPGTEITERETL